MGMPWGIGMGVMIAVVITLLGAILLTWLVTEEKLEMGMLGYGIMAFQFLGGAVGALAAMLAVKHRKLQVCLMTGAGYYLMLLAMNALFFGGQYEGMLTTGLVLLAASGITAILGSREGKPGKRKKRVGAYR